ncbi:7737_t:CDS:2, partial [Entrophospora sp. SA101]
MLKYNLGVPLFVDIDLPSASSININTGDCIDYIAIAKAIADSASATLTANSAGNESFFDTDALYYLSLIVGKRKFNPSKGSVTKTDAKDHISTIVFKILYDEIRTSEIDIIAEQLEYYQMSIGRTPVDNDRLLNDFIEDKDPVAEPCSSHKNIKNELGFF